jgi:wyosine [tRNA(Phe)-imidazoG37] synthetase (radical SAM superfamily)
MSDQPYLTVEDHNRDVSGMRYVYPVVSRRAGGVSIGINLNVNNACNWRCVYCQVPDLKRGSPTPIDMTLLEQELRRFLDYALHGDFMTRYVAEGDRQLQDIAFSGNGEPTSAKEFPDILIMLEKILLDFNLLGKAQAHPISANPIKVRLISNGSLMDKASVLASLKHLARLNGEVWFKLDGGTQAGIARINDVNIKPKAHLQRLRNCVAVCPTFVQTCLFAMDGEPPSEEDTEAYLGLLDQVKSDLQGVHLYGYARPSYQVEAPRISRLPHEKLEAMAERIRALGLIVHVSD